MLPKVRPRLLLVEDDKETRDMLAHWLAYEFDVVTANDGIQGLAAATTVEPAPDVVVTDVWMPCLDGVEMVRRLKAVDSLRRIPVIFLSGQISPTSMIAGIAAGARAYLPKPVDLDVLDRKLRSSLPGRLATARTA